MIQRMRTLPMISMATLFAAVLSRPALAGPPLLCFPFDIGNARSLPMGHGNWRETDAGYDVSHLVTDTLELLAPATPILVRMETLRRATLYAAAHPPLATALLDGLQARAAAPPPAIAALSIFDVGYLVESYKEARFLFKEWPAAIDRIDGYPMVLNANAMRQDAGMQHAAQLIIDGYPRATR